MRFTIYGRLGGAGIKGMAVPQSACCAGSEPDGPTTSQRDIVHQPQVKASQSPSGGSGKKTGEFGEAGIFIAGHIAAPGDGRTPAAGIRARLWESRSVKLTVRDNKRGQ